MINDEIYGFLRTLKENNNKVWFDKNKASYEVLKQRYHELASKILAELSKYDDSLSNLDAKQCVFRIHKDVRFSKDKSPYKTSLGIIMTPFGKRMQLAGYYVHIEDGKNFIGGGLYLPPNDLVKKVRQEIINFPDDFVKIIQDKNFKSNFVDLDKSKEVMLAKVPKEVDPASPIADYTRLKSFTTGKKYSNEEVCSADFVVNCCRDLSSMKDVIHFINRGLMSDVNGGL